MPNIQILPFVPMVTVTPTPSVAPAAANETKDPTTLSKAPQAKEASKPKSTNSKSSNAGGSPIQRMAVMWFLASAAAKGANANFLTLHHPQRKGPQGLGYDKFVSFALTDVSSREVHNVVPEHPYDSYPFPRNLVAVGPKDTVVMSDPNVQQPHKRASANAIVKYLEKKNIPYQLLSNPTNMANLHYDEKLDLLVMMHTPWKNSDSWSLSPRNKKQIDGVITAFGKPKNIIQLWADNSERYKTRKSLKCYDLDVFFHMTTNAKGEKIALLYKPCVSKFSKIDKMDRDNVVKQFEELGISIIDLSENDFKKLAANAISPDPGKILFGHEVSTELKEQLKKKGMEPFVSPVPIGFTEEIPGKIVPFSVHCVTADLPVGRVTEIEEENPKAQQQKPAGHGRDEL